MTDKKISELGTITQGDIASGDWVAVVDSSENATKKFDFSLVIAATNSFDDVTAFFASTDTYAADTIVETRAEGFAYKAVDTATATTVANAGGQNFEVLPGAKGHNPIQWGAPADGLSTDNAAIQAMFDYLNSLDEHVDGPVHINFEGLFFIDTANPITSQRGNIYIDAHGAQFLWQGDGTLFNLGAQVDQTNLAAETPSNFNMHVFWFGGFFNAGRDGKSSNATGIGIDFGNVRVGGISHTRSRNLRQLVRFCGTGSFTASNLNCRNYQYAIYCYAAGSATLLMQDVTVEHCNLSIIGETPAPTIAPYAVYSEGHLSGWTLKENTCAVNHGGLFKFPTGSSRVGEQKESREIYLIRNFCEQSQDTNPYIHVYQDYGGIINLSVIEGVYPGNANGGANIRVERVGSAGGVGGNNNAMLRVIGASFPTTQAKAIQVDFAQDRSRAEFSQNLFRQRSSSGGQIFDLHIGLEATVGNNSWLEDDLPLGMTATTNSLVTIEKKGHRQRFASAATVEIPVDCGWAEFTGTADINTISASSTDGEVLSGHLVTITFANTATLKHGTGNLSLPGATDIVGSADKAVRLFYDGPNSVWKVLQ